LSLNCKSAKFRTKFKAVAMKSVRLFPALLLSLVFLSGKESAVTVFPLTGEITNPEQELSGLAWYDDLLVLLPQYPDDHLYAIPRDWLVGYLEGEPGKTIVPRKLRFEAPDFARTIPGFEGYEAIVFDGDDVYMTIEAKQAGVMIGYLAHGAVDPHTLTITLEANPLPLLEPPVNLKNMGFEALLLYRNRLIALFEANGAAVNPRPRARAFTRQLEPLPDLSLPAIEYRITDATAVDSAGRFWAVNYFWPGDAEVLHPRPDPLRARYGAGASHARSRAVERLLPLRIIGDRIELADQAPIQLELVDAETSRNWEGIVRLGTRGFVLVTDEHPGTILAFVPFPE
jgi:hypothetical protein